MIDITPVVESDRALDHQWSDRSELMYWFRRVYGQDEMDDEVRLYHLEPLLLAIVDGRKTVSW